MKQWRKSGFTKNAKILSPNINFASKFFMENVKPVAELCYTFNFVAFELTEQ